MAKAFVIGEKHQVMGFKGVGFEVIPASNSQQMAKELFHLSRNPDAGLVLVTETLAKEAHEVINDFRIRSSAILVIIPTHEGSIHLSFNEMRKMVEHSMGIDLLGKGDVSKET